MSSDEFEGIDPALVKQWEEDARKPAAKVLPRTELQLETRTVEHHCGKHGTRKLQQVRLEGAWPLPVCDECQDERKRAEEAEWQAMKRKSEIDAARLVRDRRASQSGIPLRFRDSSFASYRADQPAQAKKLAQCREYAEGFAENARSGPSLILCGTTGTGKTHLALAIANVVLDTHYVVYSTAIKALRSVKATYSKGSTQTEQDAINHFVRPDLLILDEVGVQYGSDAEHNILFEIINERYEAMKPTILISNLNLEELRELLGDRVIDRLKENGGKVLVFDWASNRGK